MLQTEANNTKNAVSKAERLAIVYKTSAELIKELGAMLAKDGLVEWVGKVSDVESKQRFTISYTSSPGKKALAEAGNFVIYFHFSYDGMSKQNLDSIKQLQKNNFVKFTTVADKKRTSSFKRDKNVDRYTISFPSNLLKEVVIINP